MNDLEAFVRARLEDELKAAEERRTSSPIHETGCFYYNNQYDPAFCDCDGPDHALRDVKAKIALLEDILSEKHHVVEEDPWYTCPAATEARDGGTYAETAGGGYCSCGRDTGVERRLKTFAGIWDDHDHYRVEWRP